MPSARHPAPGAGQRHPHPHIGGSTEEAQERIGAEVARKLVDYSDSGSTMGAGQLPPQVQLPPRPMGTRFIQVQRKRAGMLGASRGAGPPLGQTSPASITRLCRCRLCGARRRRSAADTQAVLADIRRWKAPSAPVCCTNTRSEALRGNLHRWVQGFLPSISDPSSHLYFRHLRRPLAGDAEIQRLAAAAVDLVQLGGDVVTNARIASGNARPSMVCTSNRRSLLVTVRTARR